MRAPPFGMLRCMSRSTAIRHDHGDEVAAWERKAAIPMLILAGLSILILLSQVYLESFEDLGSSWIVRALSIADLVILLGFAAEAYRIYLVPHGVSATCSRIRSMCSSRS